MNAPSASSGCAPTAERLPELALGILAGTERADVLAHLDHCATCRDASAGWAAAVDALPMVLADEEPPAGFAARTLDRVRADQARVPRRSIMQRLLRIAAVGALVMIATLAVVRIIDARSTSSSAAAVSTARMIAHRGRMAGNAYITTGTDRYVFVSVDYGVRTGMYRVEAVDAANRVTALGDVAVTGGHGVWAGELPDRARNAPAMLRLIDSEGWVLCSARFDGAA